MCVCVSVCAPLSLISASAHHTHSFQSNSISNVTMCSNHFCEIMSVSEQVSSTTDAETDSPASNSLLCTKSRFLLSI